MIRARARGYEKRQRSKPGHSAKAKLYMKEYTETEKYKANDRARYTPKRRQQMLDRHRRWTYGVPAGFGDVLMVLQTGNCAICGRPFDYEGRRVLHYLDHDHTTGKVRGLISRLCNTFEGFVKKLGMTPFDYAQKIQAYLNNPPAAELEICL